MADLSHWLTEPEAARILGISTATLYRKVAAGTAPERKMRPRGNGLKPEPVYNPNDVAAMAAPKPHVMPRGAQIPTEPLERTAAPAVVDLTPIAMALERVLLARIPPPMIPPPAPKPYVTAAEVGESLGISEKLVHRLVSKGVWPGFRDGKVWKLKTSDICNLDVLQGLQKLKQATEELRAAVGHRKAAGI
jgi:predicted DNA-binding transcriptional regulator AlpA